MMGWGNKNPMCDFTVSFPAEVSEGAMYADYSHNVAGSPVPWAPARGLSIS